MVNVIVHSTPPSAILGLPYAEVYYGGSFATGRQLSSKDHVVDQLSSPNPSQNAWHPSALLKTLQYIKKGTLLDPD